MAEHQIARHDGTALFGITIVQLWNIPGDNGLSARGDKVGRKVCDASPIALDD